MKIGVSAFAWTTRFTTSHLDLFPAVRDHGIECFEIGMFDPADLPAAAIRKAIEEARAGDVVILAGKGHETYQIFRDRTIHFDDREVAREALRSFGFRRETE